MTVRPVSTSSVVESLSQVILGWGCAALWLVDHRAQVPILALYMTVSSSSPLSPLKLRRPVNISLGS